MRDSLLGLGLCAAALLACGGSDVERVAPYTYAIDCGRHMSNCYVEAAETCPYGFDVKDSQRGALFVRCRRPRFCRAQSECSGAEHCVQSKRYPGKAVCLER